MPEGTFAIASPDTRRPRQGAKNAKATKYPTKKAFNEAGFVAMCEDAAEAERLWYLANKKISDLAGGIPPALDAEVAHLATVAAEKFSALLTKQAKTPAALRAKAKTIIASYYDPPGENCDLWSVTQDAARLAEVAPRADVPLSASDREIIRLVNEFKRKEEKIKGLTAEEESCPSSHPKAQAASRKIRKLVDRGWEIRMRVAELAATNPEALVAKAWLTLWESTDGDVDSEPVSDAKRVPWSLAKDILGGVISIPVPARSTDDAALLALCEKWQETNYDCGELGVEADRLSKTEADRDNSPKVRRIEARREKLQEMLDGDLRHQIMDSKAKTPVGARAKALVVQALVQRQMGFCVDDDTLHLVGALADDLRDMAWPMTGAHVADADATLVKLCADHIANHQAFNAYEGGLDAADNPLWQTYMDTYDALEDARATTFAGLVAKARVIKVEVRMPNGEDIPEEVASWMWGLVNDLVNLDPQVTKTTSGITEIHHLALEMGRLDREANEADNLFTDEGVAVGSALTEQIDKAACSIMKMKPQTLTDVMGKLMATIGGIDPMGAHLDDFPELREIEATVRTSIEDCLVALQEMTGQKLVDMGGSYFMTRRVQDEAR